MDVWQTVVLAIVEGVTEFLPVSSTGHLILASEVLGVMQTEFVKSFEIAIQLGAILAVVWLYRDKLIKDIKLMKILSVAFVPTGILGLMFYKIVKTYLLGNAGVVVGALLLGGLLMIGAEKFSIFNFQFSNKKIRDLSYGESVVIGLVQSVSMVPGVSRAMATILGGMGVGLSRAEATEFSFLLAIPTMAAATGLDLVKSGGSFTAGEWMTLGVGFAIAFGAALAAVKWLIGYVQKHNFTSFGVYRIVVAAWFALIFWR